MAAVLTVSRTRWRVWWIVLFAMLAAMLLAAPHARGANVAEDATAGTEPQPVEGDTHEERVVVDPEPEWSGWGDWHEGWHPGGPRIDVWVDRGDWSVYRPGDRLWVYFRVDRPCYVTIIDYPPDGGVEILFPNRWSGSNFVRPGRTYRIPESRRYSLRIAGFGGVETLVACAHEAPWPGGPGGYWTPPYRPSRGRVVVGRPGGFHPPGRRGRVIIGPPYVWPVPSRWLNRPDRWGCDSVSFHVEVAGSWWGGAHPWDNGPWDDDDWDDDDGYAVFRDRFRMRRCSDTFQRDIRCDGETFVVTIECVESRSGDPTEIVGRLVRTDGWGSEVLFRIDVDGKHGERPRRGRVFTANAGDFRVEVEIDGFEIEQAEPWTPRRINWIRFDVRVLDD